jgi:hypothetical protein
MKNSVLTLLAQQQLLPNCRAVASQDLPPALEAPQPLVRYFDPHHGFYRVGWLMSSRTLKRGRQKGRVILTIAAIPNGQVMTRNGDGVEIVYDHRPKGTPPR